MERLVSAILVVVGLLNLFPIIGIASAEILANLYGNKILEGDLLVLMLHRALLFGILGSFIIYSVFKGHLRSTAIAMGLVSMLGFTVLVFTSAESAWSSKSIPA